MEEYGGISCNEIVELLTEYLEGTLAADLRNWKQG